MQKPKSAQQMAVSKKWVSFAGWGPSDKRCSRASNSLFKCGSNSLFIAHTFVSNSQIISLQWSQICGRTFTAWIFHFSSLFYLQSSDYNWQEIMVTRELMKTPSLHHTHIQKWSQWWIFLDCMKHYFSILDI